MVGQKSLRIEDELENQGFSPEQIMLLYNPMVYKSSDIIDTLVYRLGLVNHQWSLSTAVGMMKSVVSFILVVISYRIASKHFDYQVF